MRQVSVIVLAFLLGCTGGGEDDESTTSSPSNSLAGSALATACFYRLSLGSAAPPTRPSVRYVPPSLRSLQGSCGRGRALRSLALGVENRSQAPILNTLPRILGSLCGN